MNKETKKNINNDLWKLYVTDRSFNGVDLSYGIWLENRLLNIESQNKDLTKALEAIRDLTSDEQLPLMKALHEIAHKTLKAK